MYRLFFALALLGAVIVPAAADAPFAPIANVPDYVVTQVERGIHSKEAITETVRHRGGWTRLDRGEGENRTTEYFTDNLKTDIHSYGTGRSIQIMLGEESSLPRNTQPRNTGERQTHLGEGCTVWDVQRIVEASGLTHFSCIADDGIELWSKWISANGLIGHTEATSVERRPVAADEVQPPRSLLAVDWWSAEQPAAPGATPDYETLLQLDNTDTVRTRLTRAHGGWLYVEEAVNGMRRSVGVSHEAARLSFSASTTETGAPHRLGLSRSPLPPGMATPEPIPPKELDRSDTVLGERCRWFDMTPNMMDAGRNACLTRDSIALKEEHWSRGSGQRWTAVRFVRRPVTLGEVTPPPALLDPKLWGIP